MNILKNAVNTNYPDSGHHSANAMFGFIRTIYEDYLHLRRIQYGGTGYSQPRRYFGEDWIETGIWSSGIEIPNTKQIATGCDIFAGPAFTYYACYPTSIEFVFLDTDRFDEVGDLVGFLGPSSIQSILMSVPRWVLLEPDRRILRKT